VWNVHAFQKIQLSPCSILISATQKEHYNKLLHTSIQVVVSGSLCSR